MKRMYIILIIFLCLLLISCNNQAVDEKHDENNNEQSLNLDNNDNNENLNNNEETVTDFIISTNIDLYLYETKTIEIEYDEKISVVFILSTESDIIEINELDIKAIKTGTATIKVKEERSGITKEININVSLKKNKDIDFYNGYYVYDAFACLYGAPEYNEFVEGGLQGIKYIYFDDDTIFKEINLPGKYPTEITNMVFEKAYLICGENSTGYDAILISENEIYGAIVYVLNDENYYYKLVFTLNYTESPSFATYLVDKEVNKDLGLLNGKYVATYTIYELSGGGITGCTPSKFGIRFLDISDEVRYIEKEYDDFDVRPTYNLMFIDTEVAKRDGYSYSISRDDVDKLYGAYNDQDKLLYQILKTKDGRFFWLETEVLENDNHLYLLSLSQIELFNSIIK